MRRKKINVGSFNLDCDNTIVWEHEGENYPEAMLFILEEVEKTFEKDYSIEKQWAMLQDAASCWLDSTSGPFNPGWCTVDEFEAVHVYFMWMDIKNGTRKQVPKMVYAQL